MSQKYIFSSFPFLRIGYDKKNYLNDNRASFQNLRNFQIKLQLYEKGQNIQILLKIQLIFHIL